MFKQLAYFQYLQADLSALQDRSKDLNALLADAYSPPEIVHCSLRNHIDAILAQEEQLSSILAVILQQVAADSFVPAKIDSLLIAQIAPVGLPEWFLQVAEVEYAKAKAQLDGWARNLGKLHELEQKRKGMREEREVLETLYRRTLAMSATHKDHHFTDIDIMQDVTHLSDRIKHVRKTFQYFCKQVAGKVEEFLQQLINKTLNFTRPQSPPSLHQGRMVSEVFRHSGNLSKAYSSNFPADLPQESFKTYGKVRNISPKNYLLSARSNDSKTKPSRQKQRQDDYYLISQEWKGHNPALVPPHRQKQSLAQPISNRIQSPCRNHHQNSHRHTCEMGSEWLRSAKSQQRFKTLPGGSKYNYRKYIPTGLSEYFI